MDGSMLDQTPYSNNLTASGTAPSLTTDRMGRANSAYSFSGSNYLYTTGVTNTGLSINSPMTMAAWINLNSTSGTEDVIDPMTNPTTTASQLRINGDHLQVSEWGGGIAVSSSAPLAAGQWYFIASTYDGTTWNIYLDGQNVGTSTTAPQTGTLGRIDIGSYGGGEYFNGDISQVRLYSRALSPAAIQALYQTYD
jgi:hypothetical protein